MQTVVNFPDTGSHIFDAFEKMFMAHGAPKGHALFSRTARGRDGEIYLLSPDAAAWAEALPGYWTPIQDPRSNRWSFMIGHAGAPTELGITIGAD